MTTSWASVPRTRAPRAELPPTPSTPFGVRSAAFAVSGALLVSSAAACLVPALSASPALAQEVPPALAAGPTSASQGRTVTFDYSAEVAPNDVYDTRRAEAPLPVFRALGEQVQVQADYTGPAARLGLLARLSSTTGWSASVPLANEVDVDGAGRVLATLDLRRLEQRAALVADQTQMPFEGVGVELVAVVRDGDSTWTPSLALQLSEQQLRMAGEPSTLVVSDGTGTDGATPAPAATPASRLAALLGWRPDGLLTGLAVTLAVAGGAVVARRRQEEDDADRARRRIGRLLLDVAPLDLAGLRVVDVATPDALARLAERYGLLVLHWTDAHGEVFLVSDDTTAYRWATGDRPEQAPDTVAPVAHAGGQTDAATGGRTDAQQAEQRRLAEEHRAEQERRAEERRLAAERAQRARVEARQAYEQAEAARREAEGVEAERRAESERAAAAWREAELVWASQQAVDEDWAQVQRAEQAELETERRAAVPAPRAPQGLDVSGRL